MEFALRLGSKDTDKRSILKATYIRFFCVFFVVVVGGMNVMNLVLFLALSKKTSWHLIVFFGFCFLAEFWCVAAMAGQAIEQDIYFSRESGGRCSWALGGKAKTPFRHPISTGHSLEAFQKMPVNFRFFMFVCHMGMY